ncbi:MAG TPA: NAD-dependent epimerase/dehydratase family protein [Enhygromyxa sp.]|nr:NAD-dependent epimerase/dehydratase family protein [Enhygromyxa sp.]
MRVFVSGGSGFVGGHAIEALVAGGVEVRAMARSDRSASVVEGLGATAVRCALDDVDAVHLQGCDAVVHAAAFVEEWGTRAQFVAGNVEGTRRMLAAARTAGVRRFIHIGTEAVLFDGHDLIDVDEQQPYPVRQRFLYSETKAEAERLVLAASDASMTALSLRPRFVWGPRDNSVLPAILRMHAAGSFAWIDDGRKLTSTTHVRNLARAIELALTRGEGGKAYFVLDEGTRSYREFIGALARTQGAELGDRSVPSWVAKPSAAIVEGIWRLFGLARTPPLTRFAAAMMACSVTLRDDRARRELGYAPVISVEHGLAELAASNVSSRA